MNTEDVMQQAIAIAVERDVLAKEVELLRQLVKAYEEQVASLKESNATLSELAKRQLAPFGIPLPTPGSAGRCMICGGEFHGNLPCPEMAPRAS